MSETINQLNQFLADLAVLYRKVQNYHWNVKGKEFFVIHTKLEEYYDEINEQIDEVAEHILTLGGQPLGTLKDYIEMAKIAEAKNEKIECQAIFTNIKADFEMILNCSKKIKESADEQNDYSTSTLMDEFINGYSKKLWMIKQTME